MVVDIHGLLAQHVPGRPVGSIVPLGQTPPTATDADLIIRCRVQPASAARSDSVRAEAESLQVAARWSTLPVPEPVFVDTEAGVAHVGWVFG